MSNSPRTVTAAVLRTGNGPFTIEQLTLAEPRPDEVVVRMVAAGMWRDYGISMLREVAVFAVFRHTAEHPLYRIEKRPRLGRQGIYAVIGMDGRVLKRGNDLAAVLRILEKKLIRAI